MPFQIFDHVCSREQYKAVAQVRVVANRWNCDGSLVDRVNRNEMELFHWITKQRNVENMMSDWSNVQLNFTLIRNLNWREVWYTEHLAPTRRKFLIIFITDVAAIKQRRGGFDPKWYETRVEAKVGVNHVMGPASALASKSARFACVTAFEHISIGQNTDIINTLHVTWLAALRCPQCVTPLAIAMAITYAEYIGRRSSYLLFSHPFTFQMLSVSFLDPNVLSSQKVRLRKFPIIPASVRIYSYKEPL